jgi:3-methylcrotonyl-CoA carboxylase alpha subunit
MLAKVIASAENRDIAIARLVAALREYAILGVRTNIPFLIKVLEHPRFRACDLDTGFLDREGSTLCAETNDLPAFLRDALVQIDDGASPEPEAESPKPKANHDPWASLQGWRA